jgi:predicted nucleic acid-binding protein
MVLVDSSVWISFFKGEEQSKRLLDLINTNSVCINELILSELLPSIVHKKETDLQLLLKEITRIEIKIKWDKIRDIQIKNLKNGINNVGLSDIIIVQNVIDHKIPIFTFDKHFLIMKKLHGFDIY